MFENKLLVISLLYGIDKSKIMLAVKSFVYGQPELVVLGFALLESMESVNN